MIKKLMIKTYFIICIFCFMPILMSSHDIAQDDFSSDVISNKVINNMDMIHNKEKSNKELIVSRSDLEQGMKLEHEKYEEKKVVEQVVVEEVQQEELSQVEETIVEEVKSYTEEDLYVLSHVIYGEASGQSDEHQIGVGSVVLNRVKDTRFPNTIKKVVFQKNQYACTWDGNYNKNPDQSTIDNAIYLLENGSQLPEYVIFQSQHRQGDSTYKQIGNTYFCYWKKDVE